MGDTDVNAAIVRHGQLGAPDGGYGIILHKASTGLYAQAPDTTWAKHRAVIIAAREGSDTALDAAAAVAWGTWWSAEVLSRGLRDALRYQLARYVPLGLPVP